MAKILGPLRKKKHAFPRSLAHLKSTFSEAKWKEASEWPHSRINQKRCKTAPRPGRGPQREVTGIPLLPVEDGEHPQRRIPAPDHSAGGADDATPNGLENTSSRSPGNSPMPTNEVTKETTQWRKTRVYLP